MNLAKLLLTASFGFLSWSGITRAADNLIVNGDFQTGALAPWVASGGASIGNFNGDFEAILSGASAVGDIAQTISTEIGKKYYVSAEITDLPRPAATLGTILRMFAENNGTVLAVLQSNLATGTDTFAFVFEATSSQTTIRIGANRNGPTADEVSVLELVPSRLAGKYKGTSLLTIGATLPGQTTEVLSKKKQKVTGQFFETGEFVIVRDGEDVLTGIIFEDGTFALRLNGTRQNGEARISGRTVTFQINFVPPGATAIQTEGRGSVATTGTLAFKLVKSGR